MGGGPNSEAVGGFRYWKNPGAFHQFAGIPGATGRFLRFFKVLIQASFSNIGTESVLCDIPGVTLTDDLQL